MTAALYPVIIPKWREKTQHYFTEAQFTSYPLSPYHPFKADAMITDFFSVAGTSAAIEAGLGFASKPFTLCLKGLMFSIGDHLFQLHTPGSHGATVTVPYLNPPFKHEGLKCEVTLNMAPLNFLSCTTDPGPVVALLGSRAEKAIVDVKFSLRVVPALDRKSIALDHAQGSIRLRKFGPAVSIGSGISATEADTLKQMLRDAKLVGYAVEGRINP